MAVDEVRSRDGHLQVVDGDTLWRALDAEEANRVEFVGIGELEVVLKDRYGDGVVFSELDGQRKRMSERC